MFPDNLSVSDNLLAEDTGRKTLAPLGAPRCNHLAPPKSGHTGTKTMRPDPLDFMGLIGTFHDSKLSLAIFTEIQKRTIIISGGRVFGLPDCL